MNSKKEEVMPETRRLEELWGGDFGNDYVARNRAAGRVYQELFPELRLLKEGFLRRAKGWVNVTYRMFEKP
jgi:hypothetical protein